MTTNRSLQAIALAERDGVDVDKAIAAAAHGCPGGFLKYTHGNCRSDIRSRCGCETGREVYEIRQRACANRRPAAWLRHSSHITTDCPLGNCPEWGVLIPPRSLARRNRTLHATNNPTSFTRPVVPGFRAKPAYCAGHQPGSSDDQADRAEIIDKAFGAKDGCNHVRRGADRANGCCGGFGAGGFGRRPTTGRVTPSPFSSAKTASAGCCVTASNSRWAASDRRLDQMRSEGTESRPGVNVGSTLAPKAADFDAVVLADGGATAWRRHQRFGRELEASIQAMGFCRGPAGAGDDVLGRAAYRSPQGARRSSSSVAATPGRTTWAPCTARARSPCASSDHAASTGRPRQIHPMADLPADVSGISRA